MNAIKTKNSVEIRRIELEEDKYYFDRIGELFGPNKSAMDKEKQAIGPLMRKRVLAAVFISVHKFQKTKNT